MRNRNSLPSVCILAGGLGTRLGPLVTQVPKPLIEVAGQPFILHQLSLLAKHQATHVVLCVGYLGEQIEYLIGHEQYGIRIDYSYDTPGLDGTLGAVRRALPLLPERFFVLYGDTYLRLDYGAAAHAWRESALPALMTVFKNEGRWDVSNVLYANGRVTAYEKAHPRSQMRWIDYGLGGFEGVVVAESDPGERDLASLYQELARRGELCGYEATERFYEIGTPISLAETDAFLQC